MTRSDTPGEEPGGGAADVLAVLAIAVVLYVPALFSRGPWHVDELRYAEAARQAGEFGAWLVPELNGGIYAEKPPVFFWSTAVVARATGDYIVAARIVAAISATVAALCLIPLGRILLGRRSAGVLAAIVFLTCLMTIDRGQQGFIDSFLVGPVTVATLLIFAAGRAESRRRRWLFALLAGAAVGAALLAKGPVSLIGPVAAVAAGAPIAFGRRAIPWRPAAVALLFGLALAGAWVAAAGAAAGSDYTKGLVFGQIADRTAGEEIAHAKGIHYYLTSVPARLLPWTLLLPGAAWLAWRRRRSRSGRGALAAAAWALAGLLVFSLFPAKRSGYVYFLYPPLALLVGYGLWRYGPADRFFRRRGPDRWPLRLLGLLPAAAGAAFLLLPLIAWVAPRILEADAGRDAVAAATRLGTLQYVAAALLGAAGVAAGIAALRALKAERIRGFTLRVAAGMAFVVAAAQAAVVPAMDPEESFEPWGRTLALAEDPDAPYVLFGGHLDGRVNFFTGARRYEVAGTGDDDRLERFVDRPGRLRVVAEDRRWTGVPEQVRARFEPEFRGRIGRRGWAVYRER